MNFFLNIQSVLIRVIPFSKYLQSKFKFNACNDQNQLAAIIIIIYHDFLAVIEDENQNILPMFITIYSCSYILLFNIRQRHNV